MDRNPYEGGPAAAGLSLIELVIVLAVVAIIAALAWPSYSDQLRKGRRIDAMAGLYRVQLEQERYRAGQRRYAEALSELGWSGDEVDSPEGYYRIRLEPVADARTRFRAVAVPRPGSGQAGDNCALFVLDQSGPDLNGSTDSACWSR